MSAQQDCYIQVKAEPNISVFLNDEFKGKTNVELSGLIIEKLKAGSYTIKVVKDGYMPQTETIILKAGEVKIYQVKPFIPQYKITQTGNKQQQSIELKTGSLKIQSVPVEIQIEIIDLDVNSFKSQYEWNIEDIPIGLHKMKFTWGNKVLNDTIRIDQGAFKHIFADLINGKVEIRSNNIYQEDTVAGSVLKTSQSPSYNLEGRVSLKLPIPKNDYQGEGRVVEEIHVDRNGKVIIAIPVIGASTTSDEYLLEVSKIAALNSVFEKKPDAPFDQIGTITYNFVNKSNNNYNERTDAGSVLKTSQGTSYDLQGRDVRSLPSPRYDSQGEGKVVVEVSVDRSGKVTQAIPGIKGSTTLDENLLTVAKEAALKATFAPKPDAPAVQKGTITYSFVLK
jgi:TonB family protein